MIVVGCGRVGSELAVSLERRGHSIAIIDKNARSFRRLPAEWNGTKVVGFGFDRGHLDAAGVTRAGALAAVTSGDNSNILTARIARETYYIQAVVARIYDPRRAAIYQRLGIPTVATVTWTTDQVLRRLLTDAPPVEWTDPSGKLGLFERSLPVLWAGKKLSVLEEGGFAKVVSVSRAGVPRLAGPETVAQEGDVLHVAATTDFLVELDRIIAECPDASEVKAAGASRTHR